MMIEGTINAQSLMSSALGMATIHWVSFYTRESALEYYLITFKFILSWMVLSSILGCVSMAMAGGQIIQDPSPKTRAWYEGPRLSGWMRATREVGSCIGSVFLGMDPRYEALITEGLGWNGLALTFASLWIILTISESMQDLGMNDVKKSA